MAKSITLEEAMEGETMELEKGQNPQMSYNRLPVVQYFKHPKEVWGKCRLAYAFRPEKNVVLKLWLAWQNCQIELTFGEQDVEFLKSICRDGLAINFTNFQEKDNLVMVELFEAHPEFICELDEYLKPALLSEFGY